MINVACLYPAPFARILEDQDEDYEPPCECVQVDADEWSARWCPAHGPHSPTAKREREREAAEEAAWWQSMEEF